MSSSPPQRASLPIAVIGGGITGLTAAYALQRAGRAVRLFEQRERLGGAINSERIDSWLVEAGPNSFQENARDISALLDELGLASERVAANPAAKNRYIVRNGKLRALPLGPGALLSTSLFSLGTKFRLLGEVFSRPRQRKTDVSIAHFIGEHFGDEIVEYALNPFVSGIYAGDPRKLSTRYGFPKLWEAEQRHGSLVRGFGAAAKARRQAGEPRSTIVSFRSGLQAMVDAIARALPPAAIERGATIHSLIPDQPWKIVWSRAGETTAESVGAILLALPAHALARLNFGALAERPLAGLDGVEYSAVASLFLGFRRADVAHPLDGFGALAPLAERRKILGVLFSSSLFPERAPADHVALTVMLGGANRPDAATRTLDELTVIALEELRDLLGVRGEPVFRRLHVWPRAIPQYNLGYERFLERMSACEQHYPGVYIGGHTRDGIALPNCIQSGLSLAQKALTATR